MPPARETGYSTVLMIILIILLSCLRSVLELAMADEDPLNFCLSDPIASEIIRSMSDGVLVLDPVGKVISINPAAIEMLGLGWKEYLGKAVAELFPAESGSEELLPVLESCTLDCSKKHIEEVRYRKPDGRRVHLAVTTSPLGKVDGGGVEGAVIFVLRDMTELKGLEHARQRVLDHLSHELKTPLAILKASIPRLGKGSEAVLERVERNLKRLQDIQSEVDDIVRHGRIREDYPFRRWLGQVLDLAELLTEDIPSCGDSLRDLRGAVEGLFEPEPLAAASGVRLGACVQKTLETAKREAAHRKLEYAIRLDHDPVVQFTPSVLEKVLMAPLKNAIENTPDGGMISVSLDVADGKAILTVRDTGTGITPESQKQIFGGFYHARETDFYSTKKPFEFGAGGKGLDLLRVRIMSKAYRFGIEWESERCAHIPQEGDLCPGRTEACPHIRHAEECRRSGGTVFRMIFPSPS